MDRDTLLAEAAGAAVGWETDRALALLNDLLAANPNDVDGLLLRGHVLEMKGQMEAAHETYQRILILDPGNVHALIDLADCELAEGRHEAALERLDEAEARVQAGLYRNDRDEELEEILERKFSSLLGLSRLVEAREVLELGLRLVPQSTQWAALQRELERRVASGA